MAQIKSIINFGEQIKTVREKRNYTQDYVASELGISQRAYSKLESGETNLKGDVLVELSHIFKVDILELIPQDAVLTYNNYKTHNGDAIVYRKETSDKLDEVYKRLIEAKDAVVKQQELVIKAKDEQIRLLKEMISMREGQ